MAVTPTGSYGLQVANLKTLLANCTAFQTFTGTSTVEGAKAKIYVNHSASFVRPYALVSLRTPQTLSQGINAFMTSTSLFMELSADVATANLASPEDALYAFCNAVDAIIKEMMTKQSTGTYLAINAIELSEPGILESDPKTEHEHYFLGQWAISGAL